MDNAVSIERRLKAMRQVYEAGIRTVCFVSPIFPGITDVKAIIEEVKGYADLIWLENLNLRGQFKGGIMAYIREKHPELFPLYEEIYNKKRLDYWQALEQDISRYAQTQGFPYRVNEFALRTLGKRKACHRETISTTKKSGSKNKMYINSAMMIANNFGMPETQTCYHKNRVQTLKQLINFGQLKGLLAASFGSKRGRSGGQPHWLIGEFLA